MAIDLNNDGVVSWDDFEVLIKNFSALGNLSEEEIQKLTDALRVKYFDPFLHKYFVVFYDRVVPFSDTNTRELYNSLYSLMQFFYPI